MEMFLMVSPLFIQMISYLPVEVSCWIIRCHTEGSGKFIFDGKDKIYASDRSQLHRFVVSHLPCAAVYEDKRVCITIRFWKIIHDTSWTKFQQSRFSIYCTLHSRCGNNTAVQIDRDNNGTFETSFTMNEGQVMLVD